MAEEIAAFDSTELRQVYKAFSLLGDEAKAEARGVANNLAEYLRGQIIPLLLLNHQSIIMSPTAFELNIGA